MRIYEDYFDRGLRKKAYSSAGEEREDYLRLLDMILEACLEFRGLHSKGKLYSRGLVITESEIRSYFEMPPGARERDVCDPLLAESVREAFDHIDERSYLSDRKDKDKDKDTEGLWISDVTGYFGLKRVEVLALLLALAAALDRRYERIFGFLQDDVSKREPSLGLLYMLYNRITSREGAAEALPRPLRKELFLYIFKRTDKKGLDQSLILNETILSLLSGQGTDEDIISDCGERFTEEGDIPLFFDKSREELSRIKKDPATDLCYIENEDRETVLHLLCHDPRREKRELFVLDTEEYFALPEEKKNEVLSFLALRSKLSAIRLALRTGGDDTDKASEKKLIHTLKKLRNTEPLFLFGEKKEPERFSHEAVPSIVIPDPDAGMRISIWEYFLGLGGMSKKECGSFVPDLADCHELSYGRIKKVCERSKAEAGIRGMKKPDKELIIDSLRLLSGVHFSSLATQVSVAYGWEDITLEDSQREILHTVCDRYRLKNRIGEKWGLKKKNAYGNGVSLLLYGPPGTGKTMAAQILAKELSLPLYRVDISRIFSKYIGETEKNLSSVFDAASGADVILFFDEADALFAKRTEVSGSNDKYSNSETAFLLQKIEEYDGMSILATNYYQNFDSAFIRRITYAVHLDSPNEEQRFKLWTTILPPEAPVDPDTDFRFLAERFKLSGSNIKAVLYSAAYMAGAEGRPLGTAHIAKALKLEYRKLGHLIDPGEFGPLMAYLQ